MQEEKIKQWKNHYLHRIKVESHKLSLIFQMQEEKFEENPFVQEEVESHILSLIF